jgi:hypothetical protein
MAVGIRLPGWLAQGTVSAKREMFTTPQNKQGIGTKQGQICS